MASLIDTPDSPLLRDLADVVTGGFVDNMEAHLLSPAQCVRLLNAEPTIAGRRRKRNGCIPLGGFLGNPNSLHELYTPLVGINKLIGQWGPNFYSSDGDDVWTYVPGASALDTHYMGVQGVGLQYTGLPHSGGLAPGLFLSTCVPYTANASLPFGQLLFLDSGGGMLECTAYSGPRARAVAWFQGRLWTYNDCEPSGGASFLRWSAPLDGTDFTNGQSVQIDAGGDVGTAILPARDASPRLFLLNERSIYQLDIYWATDGYYPLTANALDFTKSLLRPIVLNTGCVSSRAALWVPGQEGADMLFLSREGIRYLSRSLTDAQSGTPLPLSFPIQQTIDRINWRHADKACAGFWDGKAYFAVPVDGSDRNNLVIAYDVHRQAFYELDLQVGAWSESRVAGHRKFYFLSATSGTETTLGNPATGATEAFHAYELFSGVVDPFNSPIQFQEVTRDFVCDSGGEPGSNIHIKKKWSHLDVTFEAAGTGATLAIEYKVDNDDSWKTLSNYYVDPQSGAPVLPVQLPFTFGSGKIFRKTFLLRQIAPGHKIRFRVTDDSSFAQFKVINLSLFANPMNPKYNRG